MINNKTTNLAINEALNQEKLEIEILKDKNLLIEIIKEAENEGIVGEENTALCLINKICLRLVKNAEPTSSNLIVSDDSGAGKDWIVKNICKILVPDDKYNHRTVLSPTVLNYWKADKKDFSWNEHVIHLEDPKEDTIQGQTFKTMASGGTESTITIKNKAIDFKTKGKPVMVVTSLKTTIDEEGGRRWDALRLDTSSKQTEIIKKKILEGASGVKKNKPNTSLGHALKNLLKPKEVVIPFANELKDLLPNTIVIRTQIHKLLDYIKSSAVLHQFNREKDDLGRVIANWFDYDYARFVFLHLKDEEGRALNKDEEEFLKILREAGKPLSIKEFSVMYGRHGSSWIYDHIDSFKSKNLLEEKLEWDKKANKNIMKISAKAEYSTSDLSTSTWFRSGSIDYKENQYKEGFPVLLDFSEICKNIDILRKNNGLYPLFIELKENKENPIINEDFIGESGFINEENKTKENRIKPPLNERISHIVKTINDNKKAGYRIDIDFLNYNFEKCDVDYCIENNILVKNANDEYEYRGVF
jgi:hypothetical protein